MLRFSHQPDGPRFASWDDVAAAAITGYLDQHPSPLQLLATHDDRQLLSWAAHMGTGRLVVVTDHHGRRFVLQSVLTHLLCRGQLTGAADARRQYLSNAARSFDQGGQHAGQLAADGGRPCWPPPSGGIVQC